MPCRVPRILVAVLCLAGCPTAVWAACDTVANAAALAAARDAIDAACDCGAALKPSDHVKCAKPVVAARIANGMLTQTCKGEALTHAKKSTCGRPGAAICCRFKTTGKTSHKVVKDPAKCVDTATLTTCLGEFPSVPTACDATGCIPAPFCGDGHVDEGELCEPPGHSECDANCQTPVCDPPVTDCGNGVVDAGEACEPPGVGACGWDCHVTTCTPSGPVEIDVACAADGATVGVGARGSEYLLAWNDLTHRPLADLVGRRFDSDGAPVDPAATIVSAGAPCAGVHSSPSIGSNVDRFVLAWFTRGLVAGTYYYYAANARSYDASATLGSLDQLMRRIPVGQCSHFLLPPTAVAPVPVVGSETFAALWRDAGACLGSPLSDSEGVLLDYAVDPPARSTLTIGTDFMGPARAEGTASVATLGSDTVAVMHARLWETAVPFVSGEWLAANGTTTAFTLSSRQPGVGSPALPRPGAAAGTATFLVAWADGPVQDATDIRAMRLAPGATSGLDPDGGILLATTVGGAPVIAGPVVAFDGGVWLVAWTETGVGGNDLYAVAVATDGTVLDATPRLLASGLTNASPAIASAGDGRSLVIYVRPDGGKSAVRAQLVEGQ